MSDGDQAYLIREEKQHIGKSHDLAILDWKSMP